MKHLYGRAFVDGALRDDMLVTIAEQVIVDAEQTTRVPAGAERVDGILVPGFVDVHVHGGDGADFMDAHEEATMRILRFHASRGTTALAATTLSASRGDLQNAVETIARVSGEGSAGAEIVGVHLEGPFINAARAGEIGRAHV